MSTSDDLRFMGLALRLARRAYGQTSPNPLVGAVLVKRGEVIGRGWHHRAGQPHAEIEALRDAERRGHSARGATIYVTLEPCCTHGRTPPCTDAIRHHGIRRVVVAATDPNPKHAGHGFELLRAADVKVTTGLLAEEAARMNESFNHWIIHRTPFVTVKSAMTLDGKIATADGESKWITGERARQEVMKLRAGADAILVGVGTVLADDPALTIRTRTATQSRRRLVLDTRARTPLTSKVVSDEFSALTTIIVGETGLQRRVQALAKRVRVLAVPERDGRIDLARLLPLLGTENVTSLLVEGGGEANASFLIGGHAHRVAFFYAPKILGGKDAHHAVEGEGTRSLAESLRLTELSWRRLGPDLLLTARIVPGTDRL
ncbi:MAG TPA: bifunctional diaminohydroxyphosphoribosylaminopyrimidine deaminase/5-amino-6-(5-phosphoribosylamino)uracil reductase RibD [Candidatus Limnocylindria bacterium]|jgi:diaminohydroxyphosphoribosylaminopyrimidine deaminase/5-amino-6-(5-phosphoribosylamino)uracil reductase|nr:bifunctional diaminohydroxyphosphoribosylaminopyrimidine deaminase/5-amino-6-(5-phosphoribosylamino)uracil reductase RibD [Candidatus Limnocylindria bacterium]